MRGLKTTLVIVVTCQFFHKITPNGLSSSQSSCPSLVFTTIGDSSDSLSEGWRLGWSKHPAFSYTTQCLVIVVVFWLQPVLSEALLQQTYSLLLRFSVFTHVPRVINNELAELNIVN